MPVGPEDLKPWMSLVVLVLPPFWRFIGWMMARHVVPQLRKGLLGELLVEIKANTAASEKCEEATRALSERIITVAKTLDVNQEGMRKWQRAHERGHAPRAPGRQR